MLTVIVDAKSLSERQKILLNLSKNANRIIATSMTLGISAARTSIRNRIHPLVEGGTTRWTERGLIGVYAQPNDLRAAVGYNYDQPGFIKANGKESVLRKLTDGDFGSSKSGGTPSGRYMEVNARNRTRNPKSTELRLRSAGIIPMNKFIVPNPKLPEIDPLGNLSGGFYTRVLSQLQAFTAEGSTMNAPVGAGSRGRTAAKRRQNDFFLFRKNKAGSRAQEKYIRAIGAQNKFGPTASNLLVQQQMGPPLFIARRVGNKNRGYEVAFFITDAPRYEARFPIQQTALVKFYTVYNKELTARLENALRTGRIQAPLLLPND
jgi:hypothetical protein